MIPQLSLAFMLASTAPAPAPRAAAPQAEALEDFGVQVGEVSRSKRSLRVALTIENRIGSKRLFIHMEPADEDAVLFVPQAPAKGAAPDRSTHFLPTGGGATLKATLMFPLDEGAEGATLIVGEATSPYRQAAVKVDLTQATPLTAPTPAPTPEPAQAPAGERIIARYKPPFSALGEAIVLKDGTGGPDGHGWIRVYTELPDVTLDQVAKAIQRPAQIWAGTGGLLFIAKLSPTRAIALTVKDEAIVSGQMINQSTYSKLVGPGTPFARRIFVGKN